MPFRNQARKIWNTLWMKSTGLEASCRIGILFIVKFSTICYNFQNKHIIEVLFPIRRNGNCIRSIEQLNRVISLSLWYSPGTGGRHAVGERIVFKTCVFQQRSFHTDSKLYHHVCLLHLEKQFQLLRYIQQYPRNSKSSHSVVFGHLSYVERSPRFTKAALCNSKLKTGKTGHLSTTTTTTKAVTCTFGQQPLHSPNIPPWATIFLR